MLVTAASSSGSATRIAEAIRREVSRQTWHNYLSGHRAEQISSQDRQRLEEARWAVRYSSRASSSFRRHPTGEESYTASEKSLQLR